MCDGEKREGERVLSQVLSFVFSLVPQSQNGDQRTSHGVVVINNGVGVMKASKHIVGT